MWCPEPCGYLISPASVCWWPGEAVPCHVSHRMNFCRFYDILWLWHSEQRGRKKCKRASRFHDRKPSTAPRDGAQPWSCCNLREAVVVINITTRRTVSTAVLLRDHRLLSTAIPWGLSPEPAVRCPFPSLSRGRGEETPGWGNAGGPGAAPPRRGAMTPIRPSQCESCCHILLLLPMGHAVVLLYLCQCKRD